MNVTVCDVGPRDGLQNYRDVLSASTRAELCDRLSGTGLPRIEVGSFVSPSKVPQMAGAEEVFEALHRRDGVIYAALALNLRGVQRALDAGVEELHMAYPLSDTFGQRNQGMTLAEAAQTTETMVGRAREAGLRTSVTLAAAFGCPFEGRVDPGVVSDHVARMAAAGADEIMLADSIGVGVPAQVRRLVPDAIAQAGGRPVGLHLHNTRNNGYANALAGLEQGVTILDASIGGLGGCPFAPRATGNIATEDLLYLLDGEGVDTGVDLDELIASAEWLAAQLGAELPGLVYKAGPFVPVSA
jgi:hydroxymethylglutaryl-CoA lyase/(R)-citramalyl-CoA lyase